MADTVAVSERSDGAFDVAVAHHSGITRHVVTVPPGFLGTLGVPRPDPADLVRASFVFLLEREPATSILSRFDLDVISRYFPEYPAEIAKRLA